MNKANNPSQDEHAERVISQAQAHGLTLATAESCTAGALGHLLAGAPGAGEIFHGGFITYTKEHKTIALGVPADLIAEHTAVSPQVAKAMASGALERSPADLAVAITGVAGPEPDEDGNPVGLVYLAIAGRNGLAREEEHRFEGQSREQVCASAIERALTLFEAGIAQMGA